MFESISNYAKVYGTVVLGAASASVPAATNRIGAAKRANQPLFKEIALGVANVLACNAIEAVRGATNPVVNVDTLPKVIEVGVAEDLKILNAKLDTLINATGKDQLHSDVVANEKSKKETK